MYWYTLPKTNDNSDEGHFVVKAKNLKDLKRKGFNPNAVERRNNDYETAIKGLNKRKIKVWD